MEASLEAPQCPLAAPPYPLQRPLDVAISSLLAVAGLPLLALLAAAVAADSRGPVLYRQRRVGVEGRPFTLLKLRTMVVGAEAAAPRLGDLDLHRGSGGGIYKFAGDPRVTRVGRVLRRRGLDELPQLLNVLRGDMSLVGPRPLQAGEDADVPPGAAARRLVRPGVTGLWQVSGGNALSFEQMLALDCDYVRRRGVLTDLRILLRTVAVVVRGWPDS